jgi:hypothetical protein
MAKQTAPKAIVDCLAHINEVIAAAESEPADVPALSPTLQRFYDAVKAENKRPIPPSVTPSRRPADPRPPELEKALSLAVVTLGNLERVKVLVKSLPFVSCDRGAVLNTWTGESRAYAVAALDAAAHLEWCLRYSYDHWEG